MERMHTHTRGFTLLEVVLVLAVLAVLAGAMAPFAVREIDAAKTNATREEMSSIEEGLLAYYEDCGQLPETASGLSALARNVERLADWQGPYVGGRGDLEAGIQADAWGDAYIYERDPVIRSGGAEAAYLVISPGRDHLLNSQATARGWRLNHGGDLILQGVLRAVDDNWVATWNETLARASEGLEAYFLDVGHFPVDLDSVGLSELFRSAEPGWRGPYMSGTLPALARDAWGNAIYLRPCTQVDGVDLDGWILLSLGPGDPDPQIRGTRWRTGANDIFVTLSRDHLEAQLNREWRAEALEELKLEAAQIYIANPSASPADMTLANQDPWGRAYRYARRSALSGIVYSFGPDGRDDDGGGDDAFQALLWPSGGGS